MTEADSAHEGHRKRLRARAASEGLDGFAPHEILELLLTYAIPRRDVNPLAHALLHTFGSLHGVVEATPAQLMRVSGMGESAAALLSMVPALLRAYDKSVIGERARLTHRGSAARYAASLLRGRAHEHFYEICLNARMEVLGSVLIGKGTHSEVTAYPRLAAEGALQHGANAVVLAHNHPSGNPAPSTDDIEATRAIAAALKPLDIIVCDHIIIGSDQYYSFHAGGLLGGNAAAERTADSIAADSAAALLCPGGAAGFFKAALHDAPQDEYGAPRA